jgi:class 3 adenylate cyclase
VTQETSLDDFVEVSFTVNPHVRPIPHHQPESLTAREFYSEIAFSPHKLSRDGSTHRDFVARFGLAAEYVKPGETVEMRADLVPGVLKGYDHFTQSTFAIHVTGEPNPAGTTLTIPVTDGALRVSATTLPPGPITFLIKNAEARLASLALLLVPENFDFQAEFLGLKPFLTAKQVLTRQSFRRLFGGELSVGANSLKVRDLALLFTDLKGSTALYERIGDLHAFSLVQQHFESIERIVGECNGTIVKTIGDAVMAAFSRAEDAANAAVRMRDEIEGLNATRGTRDVILKIGLHKGSAIAVMLNERLDYFGQTVNIAARVQGVAESDEIAISDEAMREPGVAEAVARFAVRKSEANLKGVADAMLVHHVSAS